MISPNSLRTLPERGKLATLAMPFLLAMGGVACGAAETPVEATGDVECVGSVDRTVTGPLSEEAFKIKGVMEYGTPEYTAAVKQLKDTLGSGPVLGEPYVGYESCDLVIDTRE